MRLLMIASPLVSVIIPFYNAEEFIEEAINSVFKQSYSNWEILLVDDGSNDKSTLIAKQIAEKNPDKIIYLEHNGHINKGISSSRNLGIKKAGGSFVAFLDADDVWLQDKLKEQLEILQNNPEVDMVYGNFIYWWSWQNPLEKDFVYSLGSKRNTPINETELIPLFLNHLALVPCPACIIVRKEIFSSISFEEDMIDLYDDQAFYFKVCLEKKVYISDKVWVKYRQHLDSICNIADKNGDNNRARAKFLFWLWNYLKLKKIENPKIRIAVCKELWRVNLISKNIFLAKIINLPLKYLLRIENWILPFSLRTKLWFGSKEFELLSDNTDFIWKRSFRET